MSFCRHLSFKASFDICWHTHISFESNHPEWQRTKDRDQNDISLNLLHKPLGASDYLEMARLFDTVFIRHIPMLTLTLKDQARRFTTLIDNFYDKKVRVVLLAAVPLDRLFVHSGGEDERDRQLLDDLGLSGEAAERLTLFTAEEEIFAFQRTVSRLMEMQSEKYWMEGDRSHSKNRMDT